ncbi:MULTISPECIES: ABC transporter ATP-binding protein [Parageobacillus]|uniref:Multidrug ABC transporter ATP-binding protein n=1 Tax=Parageobacillus galactosidasius TaxID=883812 RepID=A0A226QKF5_9BACL|nr:MULTISPECIES: ABC transporter ATP-binding protein [Parageobacillus]MED4970202.1 ABC transporter ATP-binding protein [Parageobacillus toebii]OXB91922.1 multidrug ABC transporter ATP-binding protein [Parageobacillus galactosidasius]WMT18616.1 ABC transporter ATP-binding protein [Parageobacillus toebii]
MLRPRHRTMAAAGQKQQAKDNIGTLKRLWSFLSPQKGWLIAVVVMVIVSSCLSLLGPYIVGRAIDTYIVTKQTDGFFLVLALLLFIYVALSASTFLQNYWMIRIAQKTIYAIRKQLFRHFHELPISFFDKRRQGELMSRITNDIDNMSQTFNSTVIQVISSTLTLVGAICVMLWLSPLLTFVTLLVVPMMYIGMRWITNRTQKRFREQQRCLGEMNGFIEEVISGQKVVKMFSQERRMIDGFLQKNEQLKQAGFWAQTYSGFIPKLMNFLNNASFGLIAGVGGVLALKGMISIGVIVVFVEYARQFTRPLNDLANQWNTLLSALAGAERVFEILDMEKEERDETGAISLNHIQGKVEFDHVVFSYDKKRDVIRDVSFSVSPGETVALVGPTGAGKTTILQLLARFYDPDRGHIFIDGHDSRTIKRASLRAHMAFVLQDTFLFEGTIRDNIRYGRLDASDEAVEQAAKWANAHSFITKLPNGYDTVLKQDGSGISQGQKQLLAIARAMVANPSILILDEATSNIDTMTEMKIQEALERLMKGRTCFVIAHRLNTVQNADRILVLNEGKIIEQGTHESLLKAKGFYYDLYYRHLQKEEAL